MNIRNCAVLLAFAGIAMAGCTAPDGSSRMGAATPAAAQMASQPMAGRGHMGMGMGMGMCTPGMGAATPARLAQMDERMRAMQDAHAKMMSAKTPDERRALMAVHRNAMREGMAAMHGSLGAAPCMGPEMMQRHQGMMQMMMQMMAETPESPAPAPK